MDEYWQYATKFGTAANTRIKVECRVRLLTYTQMQPNDWDNIELELGYFQDVTWDEFQYDLGRGELDH